MVEDPYVLHSPMRPADFKDLIRRDLIFLLNQRNYPRDEVAAVGVAFDTAAGIHRRYDERRKVPKPFWNAGEPYIAHIGRVLHFQLIEPAFDSRLDYEQAAASCMHDTLETLVARELFSFPTRESALDYVIGEYYGKLVEAGLAGYIERSSHVKQIIYALSRDQNDVYYKSIGQIFCLPSDDLMRAAIIKGFDRMDNTIDLQDLSRFAYYWQDSGLEWPGVMTDLKKTLKSYFKTLFVANEIKRYIVQQNPPDSPISCNFRTMPRVIDANMKFVYDIISTTIKRRAKSLPEAKGSRLLNEINEAEFEMDRYERDGGMDHITEKGEFNSDYDGTISKYDQILRHELVKDSYQPSPLEIYRDARSIQTLLHLLNNPKNKDYYLKGFEWEKFCEKLMTKKW